MVIFKKLIWHYHVHLLTCLVTFVEEIILFFKVFFFNFSRFLMKLYPDIKRNVPIHKFVDYLGTDLTLKSCMTAEVAIGCLLKAYEHRAARFVKFNRNKLDKFIFKRVYCISTFSQDLHIEQNTVRIDLR